MRVSQYYKLNRSQPTLDFVDVDIRKDARVFVDPRALRLVHSRWGDECVALIQDFFSTVLAAIRGGQHDVARRLLRVLREPNETHLGLSRAHARGRGLGRQSAGDVWQALQKSEAVQTGLLEDLEDTILMVEGISSDIISDITTNIIRAPLIEYTNDMANYYGIPVVPDIHSGPLWNPAQKKWEQKFVPLPRTKWGKLLLVPKVIVRSRMDYDVNEYYRHYLLEYLGELELAANTELVRLLKDGRRKVTKKDLEAKFGTGKAVIVKETRRHPEILAQYREDKREQRRPPLDHFELADQEGSPLPDWDALLAQLRKVPPGADAAHDYEVAIESLLTAVFYPALSNPQVQRNIHDGRKRIDITYTNVATAGFFHWLGMHYPAPNIFVECKNYTKEPGNPEVDQLAGRFSPSRGTCGILTCRKFEDKKLFLQRCRDTANDSRGYIIALDDDDLGELVARRKEMVGPTKFPLLMERFDGLTM